MKKHIIIIVGIILILGGYFYSVDASRQAFKKSQSELQSKIDVSAQIADAEADWATANDLREREGLPPLPPLPRLVTCKACKGDVSSAAKACPKCGQPQ